MFVLILFTQAIPTVIILVPFYQIFTDVGLLNTRVGLAISYVVFAVPFSFHQRLLRQRPESNRQPPVFSTRLPARKVPDP